MIAALALILSAEVPSPCAASHSRLGGGAVVVRPVTSFEAAPFLQLGPTTSVVARPTTIQHTGAAAQAEQPDGGAPEQQCAPLISIA